jgi:hypothetical protein
LCNCTVAREVDPRATHTSSKKEYEGWYLLQFRNVPCNILEKADSLKSEAKKLSSKLHHNILGKSFPYSYKIIRISYLCNKSLDNYKSESFVFKLDELLNE